MNTKIFRWALGSTLGVLAYITTFALLMSHIQKFLGNQPDTWVSPILFLILLIVSASITGALVLLKPIFLFMDNHRKEALQLFGTTILFLVISGLIILSGMIAMRKPSELGKRCGGNMANAPVCGAGFHCAPEPGSTLPFGDVGGTCVKNVE